MKHAHFILTVSLFFLMTTGCQKEQDLTSTQLNSLKKTQLIDLELSTGPCAPAPILSTSGPGGNAECPGGYEFTSGRADIDQTLPYPQTGSFGPITWTIAADGKTLSWTGNVCGLTVIVKGGNASNIYTFPTECKSGSGLIAPLNKGKKVPAISNITFCWNACPDVCDERTETGFGGDFEGDGNAWWYYFDTQGDVCQAIYAGQELIPDAEVCYDALTGKLTIDLGADWVLQNVNEPVKVQGYNTLPDSRPAAGQFTTYKGTALCVQGNGSRYYVIHLDLLTCE